MRKLLLKVLFTLLSLQTFGTAQIPDLLIHKGDTLPLFFCPLDDYPDKGLLNPKRLFGSSGCFYTANWRNYVATWKIENGKLYLINIRNACYPTSLSYVGSSYSRGADTIGTEYADLKTLFSDRYDNGKILADWVNAKMISPKGRELYYIHDGFLTIFEKEVEFTIEKGNLMQVQELDNSRTRISEYTKNPNLLKEFVKNNIDYSNLTKTEDNVRVVVGVTDADEQGKINNVRIIKGYNESYDKEAERVVKSIPQWDVLYRQGEKIRGPAWIIIVNFEWKK
jgi:hypothetical protein